MSRSATPSRTRRSRIGGFSMLELAVSMCVLMILSAIAIPTLMHSVRTYQLNGTAGRLADLLKFTRFEAVRRNTQLNFQVTQTGTGWIVWTDSFYAGNNGPIDTRDKQQFVGGFATLLPAGGAVPAPNAITAAVGGALTTLSGANNSVTFDARGAIRTGLNGPLSFTVYVFYVGNINGPDSGYRAVVLLPSGSTQIWTAPSGGPWRRSG